MRTLTAIRETLHLGHHHEPPPLTAHQTACSYCGDIIGEDGWPIGFIHPAVPDLRACPKPECMGTLKDAARQALSDTPVTGQDMRGDASHE